MQDQDKDFFILVAGVLAAILLVICWWFTTGGAVAAGTAGGETATAATGRSHDAESADDADHDTAERAETDDEEAPNGGPDAPEPGQIPTSDTPTSETPTSESPDADGDADADADGDAAPVAASVFDAIDGDERLSVLADLVRDEALDTVLAGDGPFTVFAPTNDAVSDAAASDAVVSVLEHGRGAVLAYHVVPGPHSIDDLIDIARRPAPTGLATLAGEVLTITLDGDDVVIDGTATIAADALVAGNGVVHVVDDVLVPPVAALNTLVDLEPILFGSGSAEIRPESFATLDRFVEVLGSTTTPVVIEGHTDSSGDPLLNRTLSQDRARAVLNYLVANGVVEGRLRAIGLGASEPVADNETPEGRALNRRIEFSVG